MASKKKKLHTLKELNSKSVSLLRNVAKRADIPYKGLKKKQIVENIFAFERGNDFPHLGKEDSIVGFEYVESKSLTSHMRNFCFSYAMSKKRVTNRQWAKEFGVCIDTIQRWLKRPDVLKQIEKFQNHHNEKILQLFRQNEVIVIEELLRIVKQKKMTQLKRQAITDFLGFAGRANVNTGSKLNLNQIQNQQQAQTQEATATSKMTMEELDAELKDLMELVDD